MLIKLLPLTVVVADDIIVCKGGVVVAGIVSIGGGVSDIYRSLGSSLMSKSSDALILLVRRP